MEKQSFFFSSNPKRVHLGIKRPKPPDRVSVSIFCSRMLNSDLLFMEHKYFKGKKKMILMLMVINEMSPSGIYNLNHEGPTRLT